MNRIIEDQQELAAWARVQASRLDMAVAFWGEGAIGQLALGRKRPFRIVLDLSAGASNPAEVRNLMKLGPSRIKHVPKLHAKAYIGDETVVIGSANASANGLGAEGHEASHWREISLQTADRDAVTHARDWFERLWSDATKIDEADLARAEAAWANRRRSRPASSDQSLLEVARERPEELAGRRIYVNVVTERMDPKDEAEMKEMEREHGNKLYGFTYFPRIPIAATMICFTEYEGKQLARDTPFICNTPAEKRRSKFKFVTHGGLGGYHLGDINELKRRIRFYRDIYPRRWKTNGGMLLEITDFMHETETAVVEA